MSRSSQAPTTIPEPRCLRCNGELPGGGYYHMELQRCVEVLGKKIRDLESRIAPPDCQHRIAWRRVGDIGNPTTYVLDCQQCVDNRFTVIARR